MEGAPVTAATGALGPVVAKLGALLGSEYKLRRRTRKDVKFIRSKLKSVHSILWAIWEKEILDAESKGLKKEALDLADDMHDAIDDFILTMERSHRSKRLIQSKAEASRPFQDFKTRVDGVSGRCRTKWKWKSKCAEPISSLFSRKNAKSSAPIKPPPPRAPFVRKDASELFGMGRWRDDLISYLVGGGGGGGGGAAAAAAEAAAEAAAIAETRSAERIMMRIDFLEKRKEKMRVATLAAAAEINASAADSRMEQLLQKRKQDRHEQLVIFAAAAAEAGEEASEAELAARRAAEVAEEAAAAAEEAESTIVQPQLKMASIVGMAGVGKTTLARLVYDEIENKFQSRAFVSVTPSPNMKEVLTSILQQVGAEPLAGTEAMTKEDIIHTISNFLEDKRYLVIIDDIWHRGEWEIIRKSFPENNLESRIVMTTRIDSVPADDFADNKLCIRMNPKCYYRRIWLYGPGKEDVAARMKPDMVGEGFDSEHPIVSMCGGVPLALLCMFSAMAIVRGQQEQLGVPVKAYDVQDMIEKQVKQSGIQNTPGFEPLVESLQLGYDDLPHHMLKTCLLYCSIYPGNYPFHMNDLVMRWVAEGFTYKEDVAKDYLKELGNRGLMLWGNDGAYQMSSMMRNFLRWKSREDNFITCSSDITSAYACPIHRLCIDYYPVDDDGVVKGVDPLSGIDWSQIRSFVVFERAERLPFEKLERVRVLDLQFNGTSCLGNDHMKNICGLLRVRHLFGLGGRGISEIPPEIERLQYLETLQLRTTSIRELPGEIGNLLQLKSLDVSNNQTLRTLPREIGDLQQLGTLCMSGTIRTKLPWDIIGRLKKLKTLGVRDMCITELPCEIGGLQYLETLDVSYNPMITNLPREIGDLQHLETLDLSGNRGITNLPQEIGKLQHLKTLKVHKTGIIRLPSEIGNLENLETLDLSGTKVAKIPREIGGLKKLESLELDDIIGTLPWEAGQLSKLKGVPEFVRQAWKKSDLVFELAGEILSIRMTRWVGDWGGLVVGRKHMHIPQWIKQQFNNLGSLDIRICKLEEQDLKILREMPILRELALRLEVVPRKPIAISGEGFPRLTELFVDSRVPPAITFQEGAMPRLGTLGFDFQFYGGPPNKEPLGIKHLRCLHRVEFKCNQEWYRGAESSPCITVVIDVVRKEAQEHPNRIRFDVCGRGREC